jgi:hypothetical protein
MDYNKQAKDFCDKHNVQIEVNYLKTDKYFIDDKNKRDIYNIAIIRNSSDNYGTKRYDFQFGDSISNTEKNQEKVRSLQDGRYKITGRRKQIIKPCEYDILACLTKYDIGDFDDFCSEFGYEFSTEREMIKIKNIYFAVSDEVKNVHRMFFDIMEELEEIQ